MVKTLTMHVANLQAASLNIPLSLSPPLYIYHSEPSCSNHSNKRLSPCIYPQVHIIQSIDSLIFSKNTMKISFIFLCLLVPIVTAKLRVGFYSSTCPRAEQIVRQAVMQRFSTDRSITPALLRMHFHDCFVKVKFFIILHAKL